MKDQQFSVEGKVIFITGALGQIGVEISKNFLQQKAKVVLADIDVQKKVSVMELFTAYSGSEDDYLIVQTDITRQDECMDAVVKTIEKFQKIDVLINNAAIDAKFDTANSSKINRSRFENYPVELLRRSVEVNLIGTVIITQAVCRQMLKQGYGNIINVASTYSLVAPNQSLYDFGEGIANYKPVDYIASKSFIPNFTRYLATFYAKEGIRANAIAPHGVYNNHPEQFLANWSKLSPMGRMCDKGELIGPFTFLASDASSYMTGALLVVDGGWTAW